MKLSVLLLALLLGGAALEAQELRHSRGLMDSWAKQARCPAQWRSRASESSCAMRRGNVRSSACVANRIAWRATWNSVAMLAGSTSS